MASKYKWLELDVDVETAETAETAANQADSGQTYPCHNKQDEGKHVGGLVAVVVKAWVFKGDGWPVTGGQIQ